MKLPDFERRCLNLLTHRGIIPTQSDAAERFAGDFVAYGWLYNCKYKTGEAMFDLLENDDNLNNGDCFNVNFSGNLKDLIVSELLDNTTFVPLLNTLVNNKAKGVGVGELILPLLIAEWKYSNESDGLFRGERKELKKNGASLKPSKAKDTAKGLIDQLNATYFGGFKPGGLRSHKKHEAYMRQYSLQEQAQKYADYFSKLYPNNDTKKLVKQLIKNINDVQAWQTELGKHVMHYYRNLDKWTSLVIIDPETLDMVNVADIDSINTSDNIRLKFTPKMSRGGDSQAVPDGYVNVNMVAQSKNILDLLFETITPQQRMEEVKEKQKIIQAEKQFVTFLTDSLDPWTQAYRKVPTDEKIDARDLIIDMLVEKRHSNAEIAMTVVKSFC